MKYAEKVFHAVVLSCAVGFYSSLAFADETNNVMGVTENHYKTVIKQRPYTVEVCKEVAVPGDKTADTLTGAVIGGIIGNNVTKNVENGGAVGALLGGIIANQNSDAQGGTRTQCQRETRYEEEQVRVYSHSTITFWDGGQEFTVRFKR